MNIRTVYRDFDKVKKIIKSCTTVHHFRAAEKCIALFNNKYYNTETRHKSVNTDVSYYMLEELNNDLYDVQIMIWDKDVEKLKQKQEAESRRIDEESFNNAMDTLVNYMTNKK